MGFPHDQYGRLRGLQDRSRASQPVRLCHHVPAGGEAGRPDVRHRTDVREREPRHLARDLHCPCREAGHPHRRDRHHDNEQRHIRHRRHRRGLHPPGWFRCHRGLALAEHQRSLRPRIIIVQVEVHLRDLPLHQQPRGGERRTEDLGRKQRQQHLLCIEQQAARLSGDGVRQQHLLQRQLQ